MKTLTYPLRLPDELYEKVRKEAGKRGKTLSVMFNDLITYGLEALPSNPDDATEIIAASWEKLGPAPDVERGQS